MLTAPLVLDQEVAFEDRLYHEVVLLISWLKQVFLHDCQLSLVYAYKATFALSHGHLLANLKVAIEKDFFAESPADVNAPNQMLRLLRHLCQLLQLSIVATASLWQIIAVRLPSVRHLEEQLAEEDDIDEVVLRAVTVQRLIDREVDNWGLEKEGLKGFDLNLA